jgi:peroxiredoxin
MMEIGTKAPDFALPDVRTGNPVKLSDFADLPDLLVVFICAHCPYVKLVNPELAAIGSDYASSGLAMVAISANDAVNYPEDAPEKLKAQAEEFGFAFPYLHDETQNTALAYRAACTPDIFLFNQNRELVYRGQLDDARPGNGKPVTGKDLRAAINALLNGKAVPAEQFPATGCNIKWKPGNAPEYFG